MMGAREALVSIMGELVWYLALGAVILTAGAALFANGKPRSKSGYTIEEEKA